MKNDNRFTATTKVEAPIGKEKNDHDTKIYWPNLYDYVIGMMLYMESNTRRYIFIASNQCS